MNLDQISEKVQKFYDIVPYESYGVDFSVLLKSFRKNEEDLKTFFSGKRVLEVGCGAGHISLYLASLAQNVVGVDISQKSINFAIDQAVKLGVQNICYSQANLFDDKFIKDHALEFDYILCYGVLHHTGQPEKGFLKLTQLLKPGGSMTVGVYSRTMLKYRIQRQLCYGFLGMIGKKRIMGTKII